MAAQNSRGSVGYPRQVYSHSRVNAYVTPQGYLIIVDGVIVEGGTHGYRCPIKIVRESADQLVRLINDGWRLKVGINGRLYTTPPKITGRKAGQKLTPIDVLAALAQAIDEYQMQRLYEPDSWWMRYHFDKNPHLMYDTSRWDDMAAARSVVHVLVRELCVKPGTFIERDLAYIVSGKLRSLQKAQLVDYVNASRHLSCGRRPDGAMAPTMWYITERGRDILATREREQEELIARATG